MSKIKVDCCIHAASFTREEALVSDEYTEAMVEKALGLKDGTYTFGYHYPLSNDAKFTHILTPEATNIDVLILARKDYEDIYAAEDAAVGDPGNTPGLLNRGKSEGPYGIWGHDFSDLYFEGATIDTKKMTVEFSMGS